MKIDKLFFKKIFLCTYS